MSVIIINGSPKQHEGASHSIIKQMKELISDDIIEIQAVNLIKKDRENQSKELTKILLSKSILIISPLYVDSLPMPITYILEQLYEISKKVDHCAPNVYAILNCGFYEASQNKVALQIVENFCVKCNLQWQIGIGIGAGVFLGKGQISSGLTKNIYAVFADLAKHISKRPLNTKSEIYIAPKISRFIYKNLGNIGWYVQANKSKVQLNLQPYKKVKRENRS